MQLSYRWTDSEEAALVAAYADKSKPVELAALASFLGRNKANVCRKARSLGLTCQNRPKVTERKARPAPKYATESERRAAVGAATRARFAAGGHPRGALGMKHSPETLEKLSMASRRAWANLASKHHTEESRQRRSDAMTRRCADGEMRSGHTRCRGGRREDLGDVYFRSSWEANYARYLNMLVQRGEIAGWAYEAKTFVFDKIKRGTRSYTPDFRIDQADGSHVWHEVKGWMDQPSRTRLDRMGRYFPDEKVVVIDAQWFKSANKTIGRMLPGWERGTVHV